MDLSCIISSGDLELYVLGMLPAEDAAKVSQLAAMFPEIKQEIERIENDLLVSSMNTAVQPSASVKDKLMQAVKASAHTMQPEKQAPPLMQEAKLVRMRKPARPLMIAAMFLLVASLAGVIVLFAYYFGQKQELAAMEKQLTESRQNLALAQTRFQVQQHLVNLLSDEQTKRITLAAVGGRTNASAQLIWHPGTKEVFLADVNLPAAPSGKQYQLWAIVDGQPVNAGMLPAQTDTPEKMLPFEKAEAFAITLEPAGGSVNPTLEEMYVLGKVSG